MTTQILASLLIVGVAASLLVQWIKSHLGTGWKAQAILVAVSLVGGVAYQFLQSHPALWQSFLTILASADVFYSFVIKYFQSSEPSV